jgi:hypothetical protein
MTSVIHMLSKPAEQFALSALPPEFQTSNVQTSLPPCFYHAKDASLPIYERHTLVAFATLLAQSDLFLHSIEFTKRLWHFSTTVPHLRFLITPLR